MNRIADLVEAKLDVFAEAESRDQGKPVWLAKAVDIPRVVHNFRFFASGILHTMDTYVLVYLFLSHCPPFCFFLTLPQFSFSSLPQVYPHFGGRCD